MHIETLMSLLRLCQKRELSNVWLPSLSRPSLFRTLSITVSLSILPMSPLCGLNHPFDHRPSGLRTLPSILFHHLRGTIRLSPLTDESSSPHIFPFIRTPVLRLMSVLKTWLTVYVLGSDRGPYEAYSSTVGTLTPSHHTTSHVHPVPITVLYFSTNYPPSYCLPPSHLSLTSLSLRPSRSVYYLYSSSLLSPLLFTVFFSFETLSNISLYIISLYLLSLSPLTVSFSLYYLFIYYVFICLFNKSS